MDSQDRNIILHGGKPVRSYIKTILGKVYVTIWDSFDQAPVGLILQGDPRKFDDTCIVDIWSEEEDFYFKNKNKRHLQTGDMIVYERKEDTHIRTLEEYTDEELKTVINQKFFGLQNSLNNTDSVALLFRLKTIAGSLDKSEKIIRVIEARISEVQAAEYPVAPTSLTTEL